MKQRSLQFRRSLNGYLFILPAMIMLVWWGIFPLLYAGYISLHHWNLLSIAKPYIGLANYVTLLGDSEFWHALANTAFYSLQIPIGMTLAMLFAVALQKRPGANAFRTIYYIPNVVAMVVTAMIWRWLYNSDFGVINYLLKSIGLGPVKWLASPSIALMSIMIMMIWMTMGYRILMLSTGLNNIPNDYYEAAVVDGANKVQLFFHITIPLLQPVLFFVFVTSIIASFQVFDPIWIMTQGGPLGSTEVLVYRIYKEAWEHLNMGYAAAQSWGLFIILFFFTWLQFRFMGRDTVRY